MKVFKFYVLIMTIFWEKGGIVFKGGHYIREDIIQGNTVVRSSSRFFTAYSFTNFTCTAGEDPKESPAVPGEDPHKEDPESREMISEEDAAIYEQKSASEKSNAGSLLLDLVLNNEYLSANFASNCFLYA